MLGQYRQGEMTCNVTITAADEAGNANQAATGTTSYLIDNTAPTVAITNAFVGRSCVRDADGNVTLTATFTEANTINEATPPTISISNGTSSGVNITNAVMIKTDNKTWTYPWNVPADDVNAMAASVTITATDLAGNAATLTALPANDYTVDNQIPTVTITRTTPVTASTDANEVTWTLTFNQAVTGFTPVDLTLTGTLAGTTTKGALNTANNITYTFTADVPDAGNGTIGFSIAGGNGIVDCALNELAATSTTTQNVDYTIDNNNPSIVSIIRNTLTVGDNTSKTTNQDVVSFTATFTEPVQNFDATDITIINGGTVNANPSIGITTADNIVYTVTLGKYNCNNRRWYFSYKNQSKQYH